MKRSLLGLVSLLLLITTALWLVFMIVDMASAGPLDTFAQVLAHTAKLSGLFYATYVNATLLTLCATAWMALLYVECRAASPGWSIIGAAFVPIYGVLNLVAYFSQITVVPQLLALHGLPDYEAAATVLLRMSLQLWPDSAVAMFNSTAYAILGIPSIIFGLILAQRGGAERAGGILLGLNALACIGGLVGSVAGIAVLEPGVVLGGVLFFAALFPLTWAWLREKDDNSE